MRLKKLYLTIACITIFTILMASSLHMKNNSLDIYEEPASYKQEEIATPEVSYNIYGINGDEYDVKKGTVKRRQNLSHILSGFNIDNYTIHNIAKAMQDVFEPRYIRAGNSYHGYVRGDSIQELDYFVYNISALQYLKIELTDSVKVSVGEKETTTVTKESSGIITSSLWNAMQDNDLSFDLAISLSEVLAWEVDFYRIEKGDRFKVIYDDTYVDETRIGIDKVHGVYFVHRGREIHGYNFAKDTINGYYDKDGENLRKVFLQAPLKFYRITSGYNPNRLHPVLGRRRPHLGTDYAAPSGTPIMAVGDGVVTETSYTSGNGNYVRIRHNSVYETQYLHMSRFARGMRPGTRVEQGDIIGYVGSTGLATGPHVCFRFWKNGRQVNHRRMEFPSADPLPEEYFEEFSVIRDSLKDRLDNIEFRDGEDVKMPA